MYRQTKLSLTEKGRRQFQLREIREEMERATTKKPEAQPEKWSYAYFKKLYSDHEALWWVVALVIGLIAAVLIG